MTKAQAQWAARHDWFDQSAQMEDGDWVVGTASQCRDIYTDGSKGPWRTEFETFTDFEAMRAWAGY